MAEAAPGSFRDPAGRVFRRGGVLYRQVNKAHRDDFRALMESGLYEALIGRGLLVAHREAPEVEPLDERAWLVIRPERIDFVSYPYEWCPSQLRDAALATLEIQEVALDHGMSLRDASAYNVQFRDGRPLLIDTLSFERLREGAPWVAYRQFCQHFLAPLALMRHRDRRLGTLSRLHLDGVPLDLASRMLPWHTRLRPSLLLHLHLHARSQGRHAGRAPRRRGGFGMRAMRGLVDSLRGAVRGLELPARASAWSSYYEGDSYTPEALAHKEEIVAGMLREVSPGTVWDLGANTGRFSRLAAREGARVVSCDADPDSVEANYRRVVREGEEGILPLVIDLTNPSPAIGWRNRERLSLAERGPADLLMALALVHHLAIANNAPLAELAALFAELAPRLIVEFVPKDDPKVQLLLAAREDVFPDYSEEGFERAMRNRFRVEHRVPIDGSKRILYLMRAAG